MPSLVFERYEKIRRLAEGGMGEVLLARQKGVIGFDRLVILKSLKQDLAQDPGFVEQFLDEARVAATLNHPNIVAIFEVGQWEGTYYIAMEYIDGDDLSRLWYAAAKRGVGLPFQVSVKIVHDCALALDHAHHARDVHGKALEIVHRDVSPQNIMVRGDGVTKLVDFGIAKATNRVSVTQTGTVKGKLQYMSPEQVRGEPLDARSDQFSLGIVLWEMCTGKRLFKADSELATLNKILQHPIPPPGSMVPGFPKELEDVIVRMLERDREKRFDRCAGVARVLKSYLDRAMQQNGEMTVENFVQDILGEDIASRRRDLTPELTGEREPSAPRPPSADDAVLGGVTEERPSLIVHQPDLLVRRQEDSKLLRFGDRNEVGQWILDGQITATDMVSTDGESWRPASADPSLTRFFQVVEAAREVSTERQAAGLDRPKTPPEGVPVPFTDEGPPTEVTDEGPPSGAQTLSEEEPEEVPPAAPGLTQPVPAPADRGDVMAPPHLSSPSLALGADSPHQDAPSWQLGAVPVHAGESFEDGEASRTPATGSRDASDAEPDAPATDGEPAVDTDDAAAPTDATQPVPASEAAAAAAAASAKPGVETGFFGRDQIHAEMPPLPDDELSMSGLDVRGGGLKWAALGAVVVVLLVAGVLVVVQGDALRELAGERRTGASEEAAPLVAPAVLQAALSAPDPAAITKLLAELTPQLADAEGAQLATGVAAASLAKTELARREAERARLLALAGKKDEAKAARAVAGKHRVDAYKLAARARGAGDAPEVALAMASYQAERGALVEMEADLSTLEEWLNAHPEGERASRWAEEAAVQRALARVLVVVEARPAAAAEEAATALAAAKASRADDARLAWAQLILRVHRYLAAEEPDPGLLPALREAIGAMQTRDPRAELLLAVVPEEGDDKPAKKEERKKSKRASDDAATLSPEQAEAKARRLMDAGRSWRAVKVLKGVVKQDKARASAWVLLGWAYLDVERYDAAIGSFKTATRLFETPPVAHFGLAESLRFAGKTEQARASYRRYLQLAPDGPDAQVARNALKALAP